MSEKKYPCELSDIKFCKFGGNKVYNYGFLSGTASYCRKLKKWVYEIKDKKINCKETL